MGRGRGGEGSVSHLYFSTAYSIPTLQRGLSAIADLLVINSVVCMCVALCFANKLFIHSHCYFALS